VRYEGYVLYNLGRAHLDLGRLDESAELFEQALAIHRATGDRYGEAQVLQRIGTVRLRAGRPAEAREAWTRARRLLEGLGEDGQAAELSAELEALGSVHTRLPDRRGQEPKRK
jgi:tetratricopeptide (TPR) repeat protein